jgi:sensor domain CHASE-containing protein
MKRERKKMRTAVKGVIVTIHIVILAFLIFAYLFIYFICQDVFVTIDYFIK